MFVQCLEQVQHYTCHVLLFSSLLIKHHLHSMLCYFIISQGVAVVPLFPPRSTLLLAPTGMLQDWLLRRMGVGRAVSTASGIAKQHEDACFFSLHPFRALSLKNKWGKKRKADGSGTPQGPCTVSWSMCLGKMRGKPCRSHHRCLCKVSTKCWLRL